MGLTDRTMPTVAPVIPSAAPAPPAVVRWLPAATALLLAVALLLATDTAPLDIAKYGFYAVWGVLLPGTLVFRSLRCTPHTLVEDLALGAVTGLVLELAAWAVLMPLGIQSAATLWPLAVVVPFAAVPRLRRHWRPRDYRSTPSLGWSWAVAGTVAVTTVFLYGVYLRRNPILPTSESSTQFMDLPYQLSLAANAKHTFPLTLPQAAGEPLYYHWFAFVHEAMTSMVGHIDLPVVQMRLMIPALCALAMVVMAVVGWRLARRPWVGVVAALLVFAIGEFNVVRMVDTAPFGSSQVPLMSWASVSMTYSWPLLFALIAAVGEGLVRRREDDSVPAWGPGLFVLVALFAVASSAAKATSLPVTLAGLALAGFVVLVTTRRIPWAVVGLGGILGAAQVFSTAVIFRFMTYGLEILPLSNIEGNWAVDPAHPRSSASQAVVVAGVWAAFLLCTQLRVVGALPLLWRSRLNLQPVQWILLGGAVAGPTAYLLMNGWNASYFTHAGLAFGALLSAWGYCEAFERAALSRRGKTLLAVATAVFVGLLTYGIRTGADGWRRFALGLFGIDPDKPKVAYAGLVPMLVAAAALLLIAALGGLLWWGLGRSWAGLRGRGGIVLLTAALTAGAPTLMLDMFDPGWSPSVWGAPELQKSRVEAARWVRSHSAPTDVIATNEHYLPGTSYDSRVFTLSAFSERSVLIEGWGFAPREMASGGGNGVGPFWDQPLLELNDAAFYSPTPEILAELRDKHHVRYLVLERRAGVESPLLDELVKPVYDNGHEAVYELRTWAHQGSWVLPELWKTGVEAPLPARHRAAG
ncbi:hypothetical protein [Kitasatospora sp. McL0602]|uniref:hypothetical protein n=1 Tax=Kitasatospora sp. McL0602 TaxID=3439530 RepID=UPI003F8C918F